MTNYSGTPLAESMLQVEFLQQELLDRIEEIEALEDIYSSPNGDSDLVEYYHLMYALLDKQENLYARLMLINDKSLEGIEITIRQFCERLGILPMESISDYHYRAKVNVKRSLEQLTGENLDDYDGIDVKFNW